MQTLLRAGVEVFSKYGYDGATTKAVSIEAGLNEQLITRYFGGKAGLLVAILEDFLKKEAGDDGYPPEADSVEEEILHFFLFRHARFLESLEFFRTFIPRAMVDPAIRDKMEEILVKRGSVLRDRLAGLQKRRLIHADVDLDAASFMLTAQSFFVSFMARVGANLDDAFLVHQLTEFAKYTARGLAARAS